MGRLPSLCAPKHLTGSAEFTCRERNATVLGSCAGFKIAKEFFFLDLFKSLLWMTYAYGAH
jgi:hypothetical protein